jgi:hypothetical protein
LEPRATVETGDLSGIPHRLVIGFPFAWERKNEIAAGVIVSYHDGHIAEGLVAAQLSRTLNGFQIQSGVATADPMFPARAIKANSSMS